MIPTRTSETHREMAARRAVRGFSGSSNGTAPSIRWCLGRHSPTIRARDQPESHPPRPPATPGTGAPPVAFGCPGAPRRVRRRRNAHRRHRGACAVHCRHRRGGLRPGTGRSLRRRGATAQSGPAGHAADHRRAGARPAQRGTDRRRRSPAERSPGQPHGGRRAFRADRDPRRGGLRDDLRPDAPRHRPAERAGGDRPGLCGLGGGPGAPAALASRTRDRARSVVPVIVFAAAGAFLCVAGAAATVFGLFFPHLIADRLPAEGLLDAAAVGGAAGALGAGVAVLGLAHLATAVALWRRARVAETLGVGLGAGMAGLAFGAAVGLLGGVVGGRGPAGVLLPPAVVLGLAAGAYGAATVVILRSRTGPI